MTDRIAGTVPNNQSRNYGIDALRIVSMLMVLMLHLLGHGGILTSSESINYWLAWFFEIAAYSAVNIYALITGYVGVYSRYKMGRFAALWCRVAFYSVLLTVLFKLICPDETGNRQLLFSLVPVFSKQYWYFTAYALLFLFIPILNEGLNRLSKKRLSAVLLIIVVATSVFQPVVDILGDVFGLGDGYSTWWLMILYLIGGYIRKYGFLQKIKTRRAVVFSLIAFAFVLSTWLYKLCIQFVSVRIWGIIKYDGLLTSYQSITVLGAAVSMLLAFEHISFRPALIKVISFLSPLAFSVYLIHEHNAIRSTLITDKLAWIAALPAYQMVLLFIGIVVGVYMLCSLIDLPRHYLFKISKVEERFIALEERLKQKIKGKMHP